MKPRKRNSAFAEKRAKKSTMDVFSLALQFFGEMSERLPSKRDDAFCLSAACPAEKQKYLVYHACPVGPADRTGVNPV